MTMYRLKLSQKIIILSILILGAGFRFYHPDWDQGNHMHPDERAIIMTVVKLQMPGSFSSFLSQDSPLNPHFFAYGSFPFYLLKIVGYLFSFINPLFAGYDLINIAGRFVSAFFDLGTCLILFYLGKRLYNPMVGFLGSFFYAVSVLPIQLSHFFAVDTLLTFFCLALLYRLIVFYETPSGKNAIFIGILLGLALATKVSASVLLVSIITVLIFDFVFKFLRHQHKTHVLFHKLPVFIKHIFYYSLIIFMSTLITYAICEPYAFIDFKEFWDQTMAQSEMTHNAFIFPYTLQYVGKPAYLYELKNIFLWGLGPILAVILFAGVIYFFNKIFRSKKDDKRAEEIILAVFFIVYFAIVGKFAIGFMRYMLPIYPLLSLFGALFAFKIVIYIKNKLGSEVVAYALYIILYFLILIWPMSFINIYSVQNTRTSATEWINKYIPVGKAIAQEHWDDPIPMGSSQNYQVYTLPLYDEDNEQKWKNINDMLTKTDYIIIASNRLYTPLQKLIDCKKLPPGRCYTRTAQYYHQLFGGTLGFQKIAEFIDYPTIPFLNIPIDDQSADESFTVYDHPKVMIFQRINPSIGS